jgi:hypothetical protein
MYDAADVAQLTVMGFSEADARAALREMLSVEGAMDYLLARSADPHTAHQPAPSHAGSAAAANAATDATSVFASAAAAAGNASQAIAASVRSPGPSNAAAAAVSSQSAPLLPVSTAAKPRPLLRSVNDVRPSDLFERFASFARSHGQTAYVIIREVSETQVCVSWRLLCRAFLIHLCYFTFRSSRTRL